MFFEKILADSWRTRDKSHLFAFLTGLFVVIISLLAIMIMILIPDSRNVPISNQPGVVKSDFIDVWQPEGEQHLPAGQLQDLQKLGGPEWGEGHSGVSEPLDSGLPIDASSGSQHKPSDSLSELDALEQGLIKAIESSDATMLHGLLSRELQALIDEEHIRASMNGALGMRLGLTKDRTYYSEFLAGRDYVGTLGGGESKVFRAVYGLEAGVWRLLGTWTM